MYMYMCKLHHAHVIKNRERYVTTYTTEYVERERERERERETYNLIPLCFKVDMYVVPVRGTLLANHNQPVPM